MSDTTYVSLNMLDIATLLGSRLGQMMMGGVEYYSQGQPGCSVSIARCATETMIEIDSIRYTFRHWREGLAGMSVQEGDRQAQCWAFVDEEWVNL